MSSVWDDIKSRLDIVDVVGDYVRLQSSGTNYRGLCPFHKEKSPSFMVSSEKQIFHCFGCGVGGDVFAFVSEIEHIEKSETLKRLAKRAGVVLEQKTFTQEQIQSKQEQISIQESGHAMLSWTADIYHKVLLKVLQDRNHPVSQYVISRGLTQSTIETFKVGYSPRNPWLLDTVNKYNIPHDIMLAIGTLKKRESGVIADKFSDRLMIPIRQHQGKVVGFTGRVLPYDTTDRPKYLNSSQSDWFNKSDVWFGLDTARKSIIQERHAIVVEGNMDVIAAYQAGYPQTIASQGTAFTIQQLERLKRLTRVIHLAFDNDNAGTIASKKLFKQATSLGFDVKKVIIPLPHKDIDDAFKDPQFTIQTKDFVEHCIDSARSILEGSLIETKKEAIHDIIQLIACTDQLSREHYIEQLSKVSRFSQKALVDILNSITTTPNKHIINIEQDKIEISTDNIVHKFHEILYYVLKKNSLDISQDSILTHVNEYEAILRPYSHIFNTLSKYITSLSSYNDLFSYLLVHIEQIQKMHYESDNMLDEHIVQQLQDDISEFYQAQDRKQQDSQPPKQRSKKGNYKKKFK